MNEKLSSVTLEEFTLLFMSSQGNMSKFLVPPRNIDEKDRILSQRRKLIEDKLLKRYR